jgi:hypothetical protein
MGHGIAILRDLLDQPTDLGKLALSGQPGRADRSSAWIPHLQTLGSRSALSAGGRLTSTPTGSMATGPPAIGPRSKFPGTAGPIGEVYLEVRWPDGRRFDSRRKVSEHQARQLVDGGICDEVRSPSGILRYLRLRRGPPFKRFASILANDSVTTQGRGSTAAHRWPDGSRHPWQATQETQRLLQTVKTRKAPRRTAPFASGVLATDLRSSASANHPKTSPTRMTGDVGVDIRRGSEGFGMSSRTG